MTEFDGIELILINLGAFKYEGSEGHTIRSRSGHCIVCRTSVITFTRRSIKTTRKPLQHSILLHCDFSGIKRVTQSEIDGIRLN